MSSFADLGRFVLFLVIGVVLVYVVGLVVYFVQLDRSSSPAGALDVVDAAPAPTGAVQFERFGSPGGDAASPSAQVAYHLDETLTAAQACRATLTALVDEGWRLDYDVDSGRPEGRDVARACRRPALDRRPVYRPDDHVTVSIVATSSGYDLRYEAQG